MNEKGEKWREREREENQKHHNNPYSKFKKGGCRKCRKDNVWIVKDGLCFKCFLDNYRSLIQEEIKQNSLEKTRIEWEKAKQRLERWFTNIKNDERYQTGLTEKEKREGEQMGKEFIQAVENELYPERKKGNNSSGWIWLLVIAGVVVIVGGLIAYFSLKKRKNG